MPGPNLGLTPEERGLLHAALNGPLVDLGAEELAACVRLCSLGLLQRSGGVAAANGWRGSPHAFFLTRDGWTLLKADHAAPAMRRAI
jgi:hypothetical protein